MFICSYIFLETIFRVQPILNTGCVRVWVSMFVRCISGDWPTLAGQHREVVLVCSWNWDNSISCFIRNLADVFYTAESLAWSKAKSGFLLNFIGNSTEELINTCARMLTQLNNMHCIRVRMSGLDFFGKYSPKSSTKALHSQYQQRFSRISDSIWHQMAEAEQHIWWPLDMNRFAVPSIDSCFPVSDKTLWLLHEYLESGHMTRRPQIFVICILRMYCQSSLAYLIIWIARAI